MNLAQRIQRSPIILLGMGVALIAVALALIWLNLSARDVSTVESTAPQAVGGLSTESAVSVIVAARDVARGQALAPDDLIPRKMEGPAPAGSFGETASVIGRVATTDIRASQIVFGSNLSTGPAGAGMAALVSEGQRAFAIRVAEEDIVGGFLQAGDRVDVFATFPGAVYGQQSGIGQTKADQSKSALLLQDMEVLAVGAALSSKGDEVNSGARTVTVAAPPEALAKLALAGRLGHITLAIRNPDDREIAPAELVALDDLRPGAASVDSDRETAATGSTGHRITIYSGANQSTVTTPR
ncbi:MAG: Flp pilus assembly protein CpaB [Parvibaculum sp.]|jgi:pilus assembly protein CpaB|uniref:Flp pilus assembly protein CpaB n=1 Tax=Parvibaculum sp. TaxID=2024848 RepID=UPI002ABA5972|nr:Flp pilus assembly protein CpaB [Parvibaculum sp.]MDZ4380988.1 Flp pilus assembly protein CpaB [Parvibaculum sp.]